MSLVKRLLCFLLLVVGLVSVGSAQAGGGLSWSGYQWHVGSGRGKLGQCWSPSHVQVKSGHLFLVKNASCGAGVSLTTTKTYGTWSVTYRVVSGSAKYAFLLMGQGSRPEIDFAEGRDDPNNASRITGTYHPLPGCQQCIHAATGTSLRNYHTFSVTHTTSGYTLKQDGKTWATFKSHNKVPLRLHLQTGFGARSAVYEIASVRIS